MQLICLGQFDSSVTKKLLNKSVQGVAGLEGEILDTPEEKKDGHRKQNLQEIVRFEIKFSPVSGHGINRRSKGIKRLDV